MQSGVSKQLSIRQLLKALMDQCPVTALASRYEVSTKEVTDVTRIAIQHGLVGQNAVTGHYEVTPLGRERLRRRPSLPRGQRKGACEGQRSRCTHIPRAFPRR